MTQSVFDGSTPPSREASTSEVKWADQAPQSSPFDALEALRDQVAQRDAEAAESLTVNVEVPGLRWRLACSVDFSEDQYKGWQRAALPKAKRNKPSFSVFDLRQSDLSAAVLVHTCVRLEYQRDSSEWSVLTGSDGDPLTLTDSPLLQRFNVVDPHTLVRGLFGNKDPLLIKAGLEVIQAAGWGDDELDPTE